MLLQRKARGVRGFTLIELLISIAIIVILAVLVSGAIGLVKREAGLAHCLSNQRQLGVGVASYIADSKKMPGMSKPEHFSTGGYQPWGVEPVWGVDVVQWAPHNFGVPDPATGELASGPVGIGYVYPYIYGRGNYYDTADHRASDGRVFFCPSTRVSFESRSDGRPSRYETSWLPRFGQPQQYAHGTYVWRGGAYPIRPELSDDDPEWSNNWNTAALSGDDPKLAGMVMLTCYWPQERLGETWAEYSWAEAPHGGKRANLLRTGGEAQTWRLPAGVVPFSAEGDTRIMRAGMFYTTPSVAAAGEFSWYQSCAPWWWIKADRRDAD